MKNFKGENVIYIPPVPGRKVKISVEGISPLLVDSSKGLAEELIARDTGKAVKKKKYDPETAVEESLHRMTDGRVGFPVEAAKYCIVRGSKKLQGCDMITTQGAVFVLPDDPLTGLFEIIGDYQMDERIARIPGKGTAVVTHRAIFPEWEASFVVDFNPDVISLDQIIQATNVGGYSCGFGCLRPGKSRVGYLGRFKVTKVVEIPQAKAA